MSPPLPFPAPARSGRGSRLLLALLLAPLGLLTWWLTICLMAVTGGAISAVAGGVALGLFVIRPRRGPARRRPVAAPFRPVARPVRRRPPVRRVRAR
jgi:hypothetical protein